MASKYGTFAKLQDELVGVADLVAGKGEVEFILGTRIGERGTRIGAAGFMRSRIRLQNGETVEAVDSEFMSVADLEFVKARALKRGW